MQDETFLGDAKDVEIKAKRDPAAKEIPIIGAGVGMQRADLINNLGAVAMSGTTKDDFIERNTLVLPISGRTGENLLKKSTSRDWWNGVVVEVNKETTGYRQSHYDEIKNEVKSTVMKVGRKKGLEIRNWTDPVDDCTAHQSNEFDDKELQSITKDSLAIQDEDETKKAKFEPYPTLMKEKLRDKTEDAIVNASEHGESANMEHPMEAQTSKDSSMTSDAIPKKTLEINPKPSMTELAKEVAKDKSDKAMKDLIRLLDYASMLALGFNLDKPQYADRLHRMIKLDPNIDDDDEDVGDADDSPPSEEVEGAADDAPSAKPDVITHSVGTSACEKGQQKTPYVRWDAAPSCWTPSPVVEHGCRCALEGL